MAVNLITENGKIEFPSLGHAFDHIRAETGNPQRPRTTYINEFGNWVLGDGTYTIEFIPREVIQYESEEEEDAAWDYYEWG